MTESQTNCPTIEALSAWHDGENDETAISRHVDACERCQHTLKFFGVVDNAVATTLCTEERVLDRICERSSQAVAHLAPPPRLKLMAVWRPVAAALLIAGAGFVLRSTLVHEQPTSVAELTPLEAEIRDDLLRRGIGQDTAQPQVPATPPAAVDRDAPAPMTDTANEGGQVATPRLKTNTGGTPEPVRTSPALVNHSDIRLVGVNVPTHDLPRVSSQRFRGSGHVVPDYVHHVWSVDDIRVPLTALSSLLPADTSNRALLDEMIKQGNDNYRLRLAITDTNLQAFVNHLSQLGLDLVSPDEPQPGVVKRLNFSGKVVQYDVDFVAK